MLDDIDENVPLRENCRDGNLIEPRGRQEAINDGFEDVDYWKRECLKARQYAENAREEANSFLQSCTELEEEAQRQEREKNEVEVRLQFAEKQVFAAEREIDRLRSELCQAQDEKRKDIDNVLEVNHVAVQVWETELECDCGFLRSFKDASQQTVHCEETEASKAEAEIHHISKILELCSHAVEENCHLLEKWNASETEKQQEAAATQTASESEYCKALQWELGRLKDQVDALTGEKEELRLTVEKMRRQLEGMHQTFQTVHNNYSSHIQEMELHARAYVTEFDEMNRLTEMYETVMEAQKSRAEYFLQGAQEQKRHNMTLMDQEQAIRFGEVKFNDPSAAPCEVIRRSRVVDVNGSKILIAANDQSFLEDPRQIGVVISEQKQLLLEKEAEISYLRSKQREMNMNGIRQRDIGAPKVVDILDEAASDLQAIESEIKIELGRLSSLEDDIAVMTKSKSEKQLQVEALDKRLTKLSQELEDKKKELVASAIEGVANASNEKGFMRMEKLANGPKKSECILREASSQQESHERRSFNRSHKGDTVQRTDEITIVIDDESKVCSSERLQTRLDKAKKCSRQKHSNEFSRNKCWVPGKEFLTETAAGDTATAESSLEHHSLDVQTAQNCSMAEKRISIDDRGEQKSQAKSWKEKSTTLQESPLHPRQTGSGNLSPEEQSSRHREQTPAWNTEKEHAQKPEDLRNAELGESRSSKIVHQIRSVVNIARRSIIDSNVSELCCSLITSVKLLCLLYRALAGSELENESLRTALHLGKTSIDRIEEIQATIFDCLPTEQNGDKRFSQSQNCLVLD